MTTVPTTSSILVASSIPRILHQTYKDDKIPAKLATLQSSWLKHNPHWQYRFWSDKDIREFIAEHYADFLDIFDTYPHNIMRVDAFRYLLLYHHGGIYADLDFECLLPMDELLADQDILLIPEPEKHMHKQKPRERNLDYVVSNALMASVPGHPFWREVVELLKKSANSPDILDATGPFMLTYAHKDFIPTIPLANPRNFDGLLSDDHGKVGGRTKRAAKDAILDVRLDSPANIPMYARHHWAGTWWKRPLIIHIGVNIVRSLRDFSLRFLSHNHRIRHYVNCHHSRYYADNTSDTADTGDTGKNCLPKSSRCITIERSKIIGDDLYNWDDLLNNLDVSRDNHQVTPQNQPITPQQNQSINMYQKIHKVSALLVTKDRPQLAWRAVECFIAQDYPNKELIILDEGGYELQEMLHKSDLMEQHNISYHRNEQPTTLGTLRNRSIRLASGEYICQWDDDDLYHKQRISYQLAACIKNNAAASFLLRQVLLNVSGGNLAISGYRLWEGTILAKKSLMFNYAKWARGEDSLPVYRLASKRKIIALDLPELYVYNMHGNNTWNNDHMSKIWNSATRYFNYEQDRLAKLKALGGDYPHLATFTKDQQRTK